MGIEERFAPLPLAFEDEPSKRKEHLESARGDLLKEKFWNAHFFLVRAGGMEEAISVCIPPIIKQSAQHIIKAYFDIQKRKYTTSQLDLNNLLGNITHPVTCAIGNLDKLGVPDEDLKKYQDILVGMTRICGECFGIGGSWKQAGGMFSLIGQKDRASEYRKRLNGDGLTVREITRGDLDKIVGLTGKFTRKFKDYPVMSLNPQEEASKAIVLVDKELKSYQKELFLH